MSGFLTNIKESESQTVINGSNLSEKIRSQNSIAGTANDGNFYGQISNKNHTHPPNSPAKSPPNNPANNFNSEIENFYNILPVEEKPDFDNRLGRELYSRLSCDLQNYGSDKPPRSLSKMSFDQNQYSITENSTTNVPIQQWLQAAPEKDREDLLRVLKNLEHIRPISKQRSEQMLQNFVRLRSQNSSVCSNNRRSSSPQVRKLGITRQLHTFSNEKSEKNFIKENRRSLITPDNQRNF